MFFAGRQKLVSWFVAVCGDCDYNIMSASQRIEMTLGQTLGLRCIAAEW